MVLRRIPILFLILLNIFITNGFEVVYNQNELNSTTLNHKTDTTPIVHQCIAYYYDLAKVGSQFTECAINNSRPIYLCQNCLGYYLHAMDTYDLITNVIQFYLFIVLISKDFWLY
jgi:hypothetical protein